MKKALIAFLSVFILAFTSCSLINNNLTTSFSIDLDTALAEKINNSSRALSGLRDENFTVVITLKGSTNQKKAVTMFIEDLIPENIDGHEKHNSVTFDNIPLNSPFDIYVELWGGRELLYSASKKNVVLSKTGTTNLTMILKELFNTLYVWYKEDSTNPTLKYLRSEYSIDYINSEYNFVKDDYSYPFYDFCFTSSGTLIYSTPNRLQDPTENLIRYEYQSEPIDGAYFSKDDIIYLAYDYKKDVLYSSTQGELQKPYGNEYGFLSSVKVNKYPMGSFIDTYATNSDGLQAAGHTISPGSIPIGNYDSLTIQAISAWDDNLYFAVKAYKDEAETCDFLIVKYLVSDYVEDPEFPYGNEELNIGYQGFVKFPGYSIVNASITDMICLDGNCYVLIKETNNTPSSSNEQNHTVSRGLIAKINCNTLAVKTSGQATVKRTYPSSQGKLLTAWENGTGLICTDDQASHYYTAEMNMETAYVYAGPSPKEKDSCFFGPDRFIAIKPKKLVVSDTGTYIWTNRDGVFAKKNINRVVYVDLDTLAISDTVDINPEAVEFSKSYPVAQYDTESEIEGFVTEDYWYYFISAGVHITSISDYTITLTPGFAID